MGTSNSVIVEAIVPYGMPAVHMWTPYAMQTHCQDTPIKVQALEGEMIMIQTYGADSFKPSFIREGKSPDDKKKLRIFY
jgi:hypothetical protein